MFDGKVHAPSRAARTRTHNSKRQGATTKGNNNNKTRQDILQQAQQRRQERHVHQQHTLRATCLQRWVRGHLVRRKLHRQLWQYLTTNNTTTTTTTTTLQLNVWLRLHATYRFTSNMNEQVWQLLQNHAMSLQQQQQTQQQPRSSTATASCYSTKYIWQETLQWIMFTPENGTTTTTMTTTRNDSSMSKQQTQQLQITLLQWSLPPCSSLSTSSSSSSVSWTRLGTDGLGRLWKTMAAIPRRNTDRVATWIWNYLHQLLPQPEGNALRGVMALLSANNNESENINDDAHDFSHDLVSAVMQALLSISIEGNDNEETKNCHPLDQLAVQWFQREPRHWLRLLERVLDDNNNEWPAHQVVTLVQRVWQAVPSLLHATSILARGGPHAWNELVQDNNNHDMQVDNDDDNDDSSSDTDEPPPVVARTTRTTTTTLRFSQQDIATAPKLERLAVDTRRAWESTQTQSLVPSLRGLATRLAQASLWSEWAHAILIANKSQQQSQQQLHQSRRSLVTCLSLLLQGCHTGLYPRTSATSPFLTQLAFDKKRPLVETLWQHINFLDDDDDDDNANNNSHLSKAEALQLQRLDDAHALRTWSVFCDVFAHALIAVRDDDFLEQHTTTISSPLSPSTSRKPLILAEHVISQLRTRLYELYWAQPVTTDETKCLVSLSATTTSGTNISSNQEHWYASRVRLFLTGTKLWNSLYGRWCRLVRVSSFCDESTWLFPTLHSLTFGDGLVRRSTSFRNSSNPNADAMDIDDPHDDDESSNDSDDDDDEHQARNQAQESETDALAGAFQDPKMARILTSIPQCLPFDRRVKLFHTLLQLDKAKSQDESADARESMLAMMRGEDFAGTGNRVHVEIRRDALYQDSMQQLNQLGPKLKKRVQVSFINQHGAPEAGIDGGGVFKEFLDDLIKEAFTPSPQQQPDSPSSSAASSSLQLFAVTPLETLMVNPRYCRDPQYLSHYEFLGRAVGKAVYESILVEPQFCLPFLNTMLGKSNTLEDLKNYDPEYYSSLVKLQALSRQELVDAGLTFEANLGGGQDAIELLPGGSHKAVTKDNVIQYAHLVSHRLLNVQGAPPAKAFLRGFRDLIPSAWVRLFAAHELQKLVSGDDSAGVDVTSFRHHMSYAAGYHPSQRIMQDFWEIVESMSPPQQRKLLKFWTSCSRQPLLGFGSLDPPLCIQQVRLPDALFLEAPHVVLKETPLPSAATCMNLLKLPNYRDKELMKIKLFQAIESASGFELS